MLDKDQNQNVAEGGIAIQASGNVTVGVSYSDVKNIALDIFQANFYKLSAEAMRLAEARAKEITDAFLQKLQLENPSGFEKGQDPDFQHSLFSMQKEYARSGDVELGDLLVDLLVDRSKQEERGILQIVLNESLTIAPKLTSSQLAVLALVFLFRYTRNGALVDDLALGNYFDNYAKPFASKIVPNKSCYQHLEFTGCGNTQLADMTLEAILAHTYPGLFQKGIDRKELAEMFSELPADKNMLIKCLNDPEKIQVNALSTDILEETLETKNVDLQSSIKLKELFKTNLLPPEEIRAKCVKIRPYMKDVFDIWSNSDMKSFGLMGVGMAIGHANVKKTAGEFADLSHWVN
ncbi:LPO_1073/Vpar_1526 family protein [Pseudomonas viridiflava]|uniref:LPO_1073/Vpar_1526 family protein n=1 Tax=Pseudomonas viridiflava TaxID=33069 RepID=UPI000F022D3E|nr:LPO_1073/Vpar_1526 family protein [Pseudomonas viridiflava]